MAIGVFGLQVVYKLKKNETYSDLRSYGWFGGGQTGIPLVSRVDRIDFSNDSSTATVRGPLSSTRYRLAATGNSNYGWFGGGNNPVVTTVDRIDFSNDSSTASVRGPLSLARTQLAATGNSNYGWFGGGAISGPAAVSRVDRIDFSNDSSTASVRGPLSVARQQLAVTSNSNYGWFGGGNTAVVTATSRIDRIDFSNDASTASVRGPLSLARYYLAATGNSNYGWFGGGNLPTPSGGPATPTVDRIDFSNDSSTASVRGPLSSARFGLGATGNSNYGWFGGGNNPSNNPIISTVDRIDFSNDSSTASVRGLLSLARNQLAATSGQAKGSTLRLQKGGNFGWFGGGDSVAVDRIDFSNDTGTASPRGGELSFTRIQLAATGNSNYGWFGGGSTGPATFSTVDRIDFSNDSATASVRGPLSIERYGSGATGNSNYGWFGGGLTPTPTGQTVVSTVDRINFSNDSSTASVRGPLSLARTQLAATGNSNYGWFGGGAISGPAAVSRVDRIDFSNDSSTASVRGPLSLARTQLAATGNSNYGWFGGGGPGPAPTIISRVDRIDFSNDSSTASVRGPLSLARTQLAATGNSNYGWFGGGAPNPTTVVSRVDRIDFSNDAATASVRGSLSLARVASTTSNTPVG